MQRPRRPTRNRRCRYRRRCPSPRQSVRSLSGERGTNDARSGTAHRSGNAYRCLPHVFAARNDVVRRTARAYRLLSPRVRRATRLDRRRCVRADRRVLLDLAGPDLESGRDDRGDRARRVARHGARVARLHAALSACDGRVRLRPARDRSGRQRAALVHRPAGGIDRSGERRRCPSRARARALAVSRSRNANGRLRRDDPRARAASRPGAAMDSDPRRRAGRCALSAPLGAGRHEHAAARDRRSGRDRMCDRIHAHRGDGRRHRERRRCGSFVRDARACGDARVRRRSHHLAALAIARRRRALRGT